MANVLFRLDSVGLIFFDKSGAGFEKIELFKKAPNEREIFLIFRNPNYYQFQNGAK